jgi:hypothetical protein
MVKFSGLTILRCSVSDAFLVAKIIDLIECDEIITYD